MSMRGSATIINDTRLSYHFGCYATSTALRELLVQDGYAAQSVDVGLTHHLAVPPLTQDMVAGGPLPGENDIIAAHPEIANSDLIIINGEGTLHGMGRGARNLLYLTHLAACRLGKQVFLVNHSMFPSDHAPIPQEDAVSLYRNVLKGVSGIAARDALSVGLYRQMDLPVVQSFDLLPLFAKTRGLMEGRIERRDSIVVGLGVGFDASDAMELVGQVVRRSPSHVPIHLLNGGPLSNPIEERTSLRPIIERFPRVQPFEPDGFQPDAASFESRAIEWIKAIAEATLVVTGRYHHVVAALAFGTPVVAVSSNTPKIEGSLSLLGRHDPVVSRRSSTFAADLSEQIAGAFAGRATVATEAEQRHIGELALRNAIWRSELV